MLHALSFPRIIALVAIVLLLSVLPTAAAPVATSPPLGMADSFAILAATAITNVPTSAISGDVGLSPASGSDYAGLGATDMVTGAIYAVDMAGPAGSVNAPALLTTAKTDLVTAYNGLASQTCDITYPGTKDLGGSSLAPGVYCADDFALSGNLTLNGAPTDAWIFKSSSTLITTGTANVTLSSGNEPCYVWWQVGSSATLGTNTSLAGNILALTSISLATGANLDGRALARNGAVTMDRNAVTRPICVLATPTITTQIHDANHVELTSAPLNTIVHDMAMVTGTMGIIPTGVVSFTLYTNQDCSGIGTFAGAVALNAAGVADPSYTTVMTSAGLSYRAHYGGDAIYDAADGVCEVLTLPTYVELLYFRAERLSGQQVRLQWATALEVDNLGFNLYRANINDREHASLISFVPATTQGSGSGATYDIIDTAPYAGTWWYWLTDVDTKGRETLQAPRSAMVQLTANQSYKFFLPVIVAR